MGELQGNGKINCKKSMIYHRCMATRSRVFLGGLLFLQRLELGDGGLTEHEAEPYAARIGP